MSDCIRCGRPAQLRRERCKVCAQYLRRKGVDRPLGLPLVPGQKLTVDPVCRECSRPMAGWRAKREPGVMRHKAHGLCQSCYDFRQIHGLDYDGTLAESRDRVR
jgi:hypothetical protein